MKGKFSIKDADLRNMTEEERDAAWAKLIELARRPVTPERLKEIDDELAVYEQKYGMTSAEMRHKVSWGEMEETSDICDWLMLLRRRELLEPEELDKSSHYD